MALARNRLALPAWDPADPTTVDTWEQASAAFARGASGDVRVIQGPGVNPNSVWRRIEYPELINNPDVRSISRVSARVVRGRILVTSKPTVIWSRG